VFRVDQVSRVGLAKDDVGSRNPGVSVRFCQDIGGLVSDEQTVSLSAFGKRTSRLVGQKRIRPDGQSSHFPSFEFEFRVSSFEFWASQDDQDQRNSKLEI
jgi:hypothetical protein